MNDEVEMTLNLKDLLYRILKKWRSIILGAIIVALLLGGFRFASGIRLLLDEESMEEQPTKLFASYNDATFLNGLRERLFLLFPEKSRFER